MSSFKVPQPSPLGLVLSLARSLGLVSTVDDVVIVPLSQWHAMHERHEADQAALRSALARVVEVETQRKPKEAYDVLLGRFRSLQAENERLTAELATARGALADIADSEDEHGKPSTREWMEQRAKEALATARGQP